MVWTSIDLQLAVHRMPQLRLGEHPPNRTLDHPGGPLGAHDLGTLLSKAALVAAVSAVELLALFRPVRCTRSAFTITTWSPRSRKGVYCGLCLPWSSFAATVATRPSALESASSTCQVRSVWYEAVGTNVAIK